MKKTITIFALALLSHHSSTYADVVANSPLKKGRMDKAPSVNAGKTACRDKIPTATRQFIFDYFHSVAVTNPEIASANITKFSKMIGKIYKESSGNPVAYSDMKGNGSMDAVRAFYKNGQKASIDMFNNLRDGDSVSRSHQTNIGLLQISVDQLYWRPEVRKLFQETTSTFNKNPKAGLQICGTKTMFKDSEAALLKEFSTFQNCHIRNEKKIVGKKTVPVVSESELSCFDKWVSFCPSLNISIGLKLPPAYFETTGAAPLCAAELKLVLTSPKLDINTMLREKTCEKEICI